MSGPSLNLATAGDETRRAVAVCGCSHDGRLGVGDSAPSALNEIALLDDFLSDSTRDVGVVQQVACGAYHTLVRTTAGLYGWGLHEDGQLGLGRPSSSSSSASYAEPQTDAPPTHVPGHVTRPRRIALEEVIGAGAPAAAADAPVRILAVYCGADHSVVHTSVGVYVTGRNDCGQLGLGHTDTIYTWTPLCRAAVAASSSSLSSDSTMPLSSPPRARDISSTGQRPQLLHGTLTHVSCGTHHTLLAWRDALVVRTASPGAPPDADAGGAAAAELELVRYPALLMACGRGDFGELGYDGDAWSVLQAKAQRQERALLHQLQRQAAAAAAAGAAPTLTPVDGADDSEPAMQGGTYKFKWKAAATVKQRRPPFNSPFFEVVPVEPLEAPATVILRGALADPDVQAAVLGPHLPAGLVDCYANSIINKSSSSTDAGPNASCVDTSASAAWEVASLHAMHHHSAVVLRRCHTREDSTHDGLAPSAADPLVLHWGCYYCSEIEDAASSQPRNVFADLPRPERDSDVRPMPGHGCGVHAGDDVLLRYGEPWAVSSHRLDVLGSGNLGLGSDDSFERSWVPLSCGSATVAPLSVQCVSGRSHYLLLSHDGNVTDGASTCVYGFGDNLHGQVGHLPTLTASTVVGVSEEDAITVPRLLLRCGDVLRAASVAVRVAQAGAALTSTASVAHSSSSTRHRCSGHGAGSASAARASPVAYEVVAIHAAMAGARHSVFVVDVRPVTATAAV